MTTLASQAKPVGFRAIPLDLLDENPLNPRRTMDEAGLQELAASIRNSGINQPLLVRPQDIDGLVEERYEIVCGHRRAQAATIAGLDFVPCIVRTLTDQEAEEIALVDNLQRVDVAALDEAQAFGKLLERLRSIASVASLVGKEQAYVAKRLKLLSLTLHSADALREQLITLDHALLLARLGGDGQNAALKWTLDRSAGSTKTVDAVIGERLEARKKSKGDRGFYLWEPQSAAQLKEHIQQEGGVKLSRAPWPLGHNMLVPEAGSCLDCDKNTSANAPLFGDLEIGEPTCTDGGCFEVKRSAWVEIKLREAGRDENAKPPVKVPRLSFKSSSVKPATMPQDLPYSQAEDVTANPDKVLKEGQWIKAKPQSCSNLRKGVTVDWEEANGYGGSDKKLRKPGEILTVCIAVGCEKHPKAYEKAALPSNGESWEKQRERELAAEKEFIAAEKPVRRALYDEILQGISSKDLLLALIGWKDSPRVICLGLGIDVKNPDAHVEGLLKVASETGLRNMVFHAFWGDKLDPKGYDQQRQSKGREVLRALAKIARVDAAAIEAKFDKPVKAAEPKATPKAAKKAAKPAPKKAAAKPAKKVASKLTPAAEKRVNDAVKQRGSKSKASGGA